MTEQIQISPLDKLSLSIKEASEYSGINEYKIKNIIDENPELDWVIQIGNKTRVKTREFTEWFHRISKID